MTTIAPSTPHSFFEAAFAKLAQFNREQQVRRTQRLALLTLMEMDAGQLDDLGLNAQDVIDALHTKPVQTRGFGDRREARAMAVLANG
jgi:uncharacterized protein YjiS (DUF1127 family)